VAIPDVPVCSPKHGAHCLQHSGTVGGGAAPGDVPARHGGHAQVKETMSRDNNMNSALISMKSAANKTPKTRWYCGGGAAPGDVPARHGRPAQVKETMSQDYLMLQL
jgi:hypothetical protein